MQNTLKKASCFRAAIAFPVAMFLAPAFGATECTWTGGGNDALWSNAANWGETAPESSSYDVKFYDRPVSSDTVITVDGMKTVDAFLAAPKTGVALAATLKAQDAYSGVKATTKEAFIFGRSDAQAGSSVDFTFDGGSYSGQYIRVSRKYGDATVRLVNGATMTFDDVRIGNAEAAGYTAKLLIGEGSTFKHNAASKTMFFMCSDKTGTALVKVDGGTLDTSGGIGGTISIGGANAAKSTLWIESGSANLYSFYCGGFFDQDEVKSRDSTYKDSECYFIVNGGTVNASHNCYIGGYTDPSNHAEMIISNGVVNIDNDCLYVAEKGDGILTMEGGALSIKDTSSYGLSLTHGNGGKATINLNGGTLTIPRFRLDKLTSGSGTINFNGTTVKTTRATSSFLDSNTYLTCNIQSGGLIIDTDYDITIAADLAGAGGIVKRGAGTLTLSGSNTFEGDVVVEGGLVRDSTWGYLWTGGSEGTWSTTSRWSPWGSATGYPDDSSDAATFTNSATIKTEGHVSFGKLRLAAGTTLTRSWTSDDNWWCFGTADVIPVPGLETKATIRLASRGLGPGKTSSDADMTIPENITLETTGGWIEGVNKWLTVNGPLVLNKTDNLEVYGNVVLNGPITANYGITFKSYKNGSDISSDYRFMVGESAKFTGSGAVNLESSDSAKMRWMGDWAGSGAFTVDHALDWYGKMSGSGNMTIASKITTFHEGSSGEGYSGTLTVNTTGCSFNTADIFSPDANYVFSKAATLNLGTGTANMGTFSPSATTTVNIGLANDGLSATGCGKIVAGGAIDLSKLSISFTNDNYSALIAASGLPKFTIVKAAMLTGASTLSTPVDGWTLQTFASDGGMALALVPSTTAVKAKWNGSDWTFYDTTGAVASSGAWSDDITLEIDGEFGEDMSGITFGGVEISGTGAKLTRSYDWTDHAVTLDAGAWLDLNGHNIVLGSYAAGTGAVVTNSNDGAMSVFAPGKNNGIMSGNASVKFGGNLQVALVNVTDATGFSTSILNTHTGGWLFATNNTAIAMRTDASGMGPGPVRYAGLGGFTQEGSNNWSDNTTARDIYIEGDGNRFVTSNQKDYPQYPRYRKIWHGTGEFIIQVNQNGNKGVPELGDSNSNFSDFAGTFRIQGTGFSFERGVLLWTNATGDFANAKIVLDDNAVLTWRDGSKNYHIGDFASAYSSSQVCRWSGTPNFFVGGLGLDSVFAGRFSDSDTMNLTKEGTGIWTFSGSSVNAGTFAVTNGCLNWTGAASNSSLAFRASNDGILSGTGTIAGSLAVNSGATVAPGSAGRDTENGNTVTNATGTLTVGSATFNSGAILKVKIDGSSASCLAVSGSGLVDVSNLSIAIDGTPQSGNAYTLLTATAISGMPVMPDSVEGWGIDVQTTSTGMAVVLAPDTVAVTAKWDATGESWKFYNANDGEVANADWTSTMSIVVDGEFGQAVSSLTFGDIRVTGASAKLTADCDWTGHAVVLEPGSTLDLNGHDLALGTYMAGSGAIVTNGDSSNPSVFAPGKNDGVMYGNAAVKFTGNLQVALVNVTDATGFTSQINCTHTLGWLFATNNTAIGIDDHCLGSGPLRFYGKGGFRNSAKLDPAAIPPTRNVHVERDGNVFSTDSSISWPTTLLNAVWHGDESAEIGIAINCTSDTYQYGTPEFSNSVSFSDYKGKFKITGSNKNYGILMNTGNVADMSTVRIVLGTNGAFNKRSGNYDFNIGDLSTEGTTYDEDKKVTVFKNWSNSDAANWVVGHLGLDSTFAGRFRQGIDSQGSNIKKVGTGIWTLNAQLQQTGTVTIDNGRVDLNGASTQSGNAFTVNADGELGGTGTIAGPVTVNGSIAPGTAARATTNEAIETTAAGTLTVASATFNPGATLKWKHDGVSSSRLVLTGTGETDVSNLAIEIDAGSLEYLASSIDSEGTAFTLLSSNGSLSGSVSKVWYAGKWRLEAKVNDDRKAIVMTAMKKKSLVVIVW